MNCSSTRGPRSGRTIAICIALSVSALAACDSSDDSPPPTLTNVRPIVSRHRNDRNVRRHERRLIDGRSGLGRVAKRNSRLRCRPPRRQASYAGVRFTRTIARWSTITTSRRLRRALWPERAARWRCTKRRHRARARLPAPNTWPIASMRPARPRRPLMVQIPSTFNQTAPCVVTCDVIRFARCLWCSVRCW